MASQYLKGVYKKGGDRLFSGSCCNRTRSDGSKLKGGRFRLDLKKPFFMVRVRNTDTGCSEVVDVPSLATLTMWAGALGNLV